MPILYSTMTRLPCEAPCHEEESRPASRSVEAASVYLMANLHEQLITIIARKLGETEAAPIAQIARIVERAGPEKVVQIVQDAQAIHRKGGLLVLNGSRRRTLGGCFFYLAYRYAGLTRKDRAYCFSQPTEKPAGGKPAGSSQSFETGARDSGKDILAPKLKPVNRTGKGRYDDSYSPQVG